ncbi:unnamed protein product [Ixodes pacificus]
MSITNRKCCHCYLNLARKPQSNSRDGSIGTDGLPTMRRLFRQLRSGGRSSTFVGT